MADPLSESFFNLIEMQFAVDGSIKPELSNEFSRN
jgi:hypothetical protein